MSNKIPTKFKDLPVAELRRSAVEDFAVDAKNEDNKETVIAALAEAGVKWSDYVAQHPEVAPEPAATNVVTTSGASKESLSVAPVEEVDFSYDEPVKIITKENPVSSSGDMYLIKMTRENPLYETRGHKFTKTHPYALVSPEDADYILTHEDGFRQAFPSELQEFYQ